MSLVLMAVLLPLAIYLAVALPLTIRSLVDLNSKNLELQSTQAIRELDRFLSRRISSTRTLSQADVLESNDVPAITQYLTEILRADEELFGILLTDTNGQPLSIAGNGSSASANNLLQNNSVQSLISNSQVAKQGEVFTSEAILTESGPAIVLATPVTDDANEVVIKILFVEALLTRPQEIVTEYSERFSGDASVYLLNKSNQIICSSDAGIGFLQDFPDIDRHPDFSQQLNQPGHSGKILYRDHNDEQVTAGFGNMAGTGNEEPLSWKLIAVTPVHAIARPTRDTGAQLLAVGAVVALISVLSVLMLAKRITSPLGKVAKAARQYRLGEFDQQLPVGEAREINEISMAFQSMVESIANRSRDLTESEKRFRSLVELIPVGLQRCDLNGRITFANAARARMQGTTVDDLKEKFIWDLEIDEPSKLELQRYFQLLVREQPKPTTYLGKNKTSDGRIIDVRVDWSYERNSSGELTSFVALITDITEPLRAEREVLLVNEQLQRSNRQAKLGSWDLNVETGTGHWSPELFRIFERDPLLGPPDFDEFLASIHPDDRQQVADSHRQLIENMPIPLTQFRRIAADGTCRYLQGVHGEGVVTDLNGHRLLHGILQDVTERKQLDLQQAELFDRNAAIVSAFGEIVYQWNIKEDHISMDGDYLGILGYGSEQIGSTFEDWIARVHPNDVDPLLAEIETAKNENRLCDFECRMKHVDGHYLWTHNRGVLFCNAKGELENIIGVIRDITQRRNQQDELGALNAELERRVVERTLELGAANEDLEAYAHSVAHDLRAPLRAMHGFSRALTEDYADKLDETGREYIGFIEQASQQMDELISGLLEYSKVGRCEVSNERLDLNEVVRKAIFQLSAEISQSYAELSIQPSMGSIVGNRSMLVQVVINLVSNAIKFVDGGVTPQIRIWSDQNPQSVRLWVEDNGIGIKPEFQKRIFKVFERLHGIETFPGTGIGLAIVRRAVESMGGRVGVESALSCGSRFWVEFPVDSVAHRTAQAPDVALAND